MVALQRRGGQSPALVAIAHNLKKIMIDRSSLPSPHPSSLSFIKPLTYFKGHFPLSIWENFVSLWSWMELTECMENQIIWTFLAFSWKFSSLQVDNNIPLLKT
ncbi:hypothetical protein HOLleu_35656 [Holothuria leucospilota]|uniref:Uncharacterized protein n=1 Tax=Holothuria leucospilota TaxID=206669 RepID=A0A9Q1BD37_HOLLE|nr:hypothetical protein HOLleu_35656 [Holothuria leucospilota]